MLHFNIYQLKSKGLYLAYCRKLCTWQINVEIISKIWSLFAHPHVYKSEVDRKYLEIFERG